MTNTQIFIDDTFEDTFGVVVITPLSVCLVILLILMDVSTVSCL